MPTTSAMATPVAQWVDLPITGDPYANVDEVELSDISAAVVDAYVDEFGCTVKRPGLDDFVDLGTGQGIDGLYWWDRQNVAIAVSAGRVWKITDSMGTKTELTGATMANGAPVTFATDGTKLAMANGGKIVHTILAGPLTEMADAQAPTDVTHVAWVDGYLLANDGSSGQFQFSLSTDITDWAALDFATAEGSPDDVTALDVLYREVALVGRDSVEIWINDGATPFIRQPGAFIQRGCASPYTFKHVADPQVGDTWMWLDENRRFVKLANRTPVYVSNPYDKVIQALTTVDDAVAEVMQIAGFPLYVISFPLAGKTLAYNFIKGSWAQWGYWNSAIADYQRYRGHTYCYARPWNKHLVGDHSNGIIYTASRDLFDDNGVTMRSLRRTGFISHGTMQKKRCRSLRIRCKRGVATASVTDPQMVVRWRDRGGPWSNEHQVSLGQVGQHEFEVVMHRLGEYRARQWEFIHSDNTDWILVSAQELVQMGPR